jgi:hypothetical protein
MATEKAPSAALVLGASDLVRFSYLTVFQPKLNSFNGNEEYSVTILIPKTAVAEVKKVQDAIAALKKSTWTDNKKSLPPGMWVALRDGDKDVKQDGSSYGEECKGHYFIAAKTQEPPAVVGTTRDASNKLIPVGPKDFTSGDWGRVSVNLGSYTKGTGGIAAYLNSVQLVRKGEAFSGRKTADDAFGAFTDATDDMLS